MRTLVYSTELESMNNHNLGATYTLEYYSDGTSDIIMEYYDKEADEYEAVKFTTPKHHTVEYLVRSQIKEEVDALFTFPTLEEAKKHFKEMLKEKDHTYTLLVLLQDTDGLLINSKLIKKET